MTPDSRRWLCVGLAGGVMLSVGYTTLEQTGPGRGLAAVAAVCAIGIAAIGWQYLPRFERVDTGQPSVGGLPGQLNNRFELRVLAWRTMQVLLTPEGRDGEATLLVNISVSGLAVGWTGEPVPVGSRIRFDIPGYLPGEGIVISCGQGILRLRFAGATAMRDSKRMRNDCIKGKWSGEMVTATPVRKR
jgi:hypothetical protein